MSLLDGARAGHGRVPMEARFEKSHGRMQGLHERRYSKSFKEQQPASRDAAVHNHSRLYERRGHVDSFPPDAAWLEKSLTIIPRPVPKASLVKGLAFPMLNGVLRLSRVSNRQWATSSLLLSALFACLRAAACRNRSCRCVPVLLLA